jgi:BlaI family transcriptional regulator, penicillinase repressor
MTAGIGFCGTCGAEIYTVNSNRLPNAFLPFSLTRTGFVEANVKHLVAMTDTTHVSNSEWTLMKAIWTEGPCPASQIIERLNHAGLTWKPKTVKSFLSRLLKKQAIYFEKRGRAYHYAALVSQEECVAAATEQFLERVYDGSLERLIARLLTIRKRAGKHGRELRRKRLPL